MCVICILRVDVYSNVDIIYHILCNLVCHEISYLIFTFEKVQKFEIVVCCKL